MKKMKLFVWNEPYKVNYGGSFLVVAAETVEEAREIAMKSGRRKYGDEPEEPLPEDIELGEPTRVHDLPCAEWYEWSD